MTEVQNMMEAIFQIAEESKLLFSMFVFIFGACIGSFLNVCIYRFPEGISVVKPASHCPNCKAKIRWFENIPLISFLVLKAKCAHCGKPISVRYFLVELFCGLALVGFFHLFGLTAELLWFSCLFYSLFIITWIDVKYMEIPDQVTLVGIVVGCLINFIFPGIMQLESHWLSLGKSVLGMLLGGGIIWVTALIGDFLMKKETMGGGDLKLMAMVGAFLGIQNTLLTFFLAPFLALPFALFQKYVRKNELVPFGPFLALAAIFSVFGGDWLIKTLF